VNRIKQAGRTVEEYYNELQELWLEIDFRRPNPMACTTDIEKFDKFIQESRVYSFLDGLDDKLDNERANVLQMTPFPTLEQAFVRVRKEATRQEIMNKGNEGETHVPVAMISRGPKLLDKSGLKCTHCGKTRHTKEQCFQLVGYPEWFKEKRKEKGQWQERGRVAIVQTNERYHGVFQPKENNPIPTNLDQVDGSLGQGARPQLGQWTETNSHAKGDLGNSLDQTSHPIKGLHVAGTSTHVYPNQEGPGNNLKNYNYLREDEWVFYTGATDHMTYNEKDLINLKNPRKNGIFNANGVCYPVCGASDVKVYPNMILKNTLVVPSLSSKLISIGQLTRELNCVVHIFPDYCTFQDIKTKRLLGRGTRKGGLYYLNNLETGEALLNMNSMDMENKILL
jgi:hypothetical protein